MRRGSHHLSPPTHEAVATFSRAAEPREVSRTLRSQSSDVRGGSRHLGLFVGPSRFPIAACGSTWIVGRMSTGVSRLGSHTAHRLDPVLSRLRLRAATTISRGDSPAGTPDPQRGVAHRSSVLVDPLAARGTARRPPSLWHAPARNQTLPAYPLHPGHQIYCAYSAPYPLASVAAARQGVAVPDPPAPRLPYGDWPSSKAGARGATPQMDRLTPTSRHWTLSTAARRRERCRSRLRDSTHARPLERGRSGNPANRSFCSTMPKCSTRDCDIACGGARRVSRRTYVTGMGLCDYAARYYRTRGCR
jgi:hypothetical protein